MPTAVLITKASGSREPFEPVKLFNSLIHAGASKEVADKVVAHIAGELTEGSTTSEIYHHAFSILRRLKHPSVARYSLKRALTELGPTGFPFEKFVAEIFKAKGYQTILDQTVEGVCVDHEIDIVAWNEKELIMIEAKFHNELGLKSDLKVALASKARYDDLLPQTFMYGGRERELTAGWLVTNTNFTEKAARYSNCAAITLVGWNYPEKGNLHDLVEQTNLHPLTCLNSISVAEKRLLMERGVVLCRALRENSDSLRTLGIAEGRVKEIIAEANKFCPAGQ